MNLTPTNEFPNKIEIASRLEKVQQEMRRQGLDNYLCHDPDNIFYLTNFANFIHERPFIVIVPVSGAITFLMPKLEEPHVQIRSVGEINYLSYFEFPAPKGEMWFDRLQDVLKPSHRVGIESLCPVNVHNAVPGEAIISDIVDDVRMIKSEFEINRIAYTCQLLNEGHATLLEQAAPGHMPVLSHKEISGSMTQRMITDNLSSNLLCTNFAAVSQPPSLSHDPHNFTDVLTTMVEGGPHVTVVAGKANGYGAELERTFFLGHVPEKAKKPFEDMLEARAIAYELTIPGNCMSEVDRKVNDFFKSRGYAKNLLHRTGHSFGVTNHEAPFLAEGYEHEIKPNMIFSVEPGIYLPSIGGFRFSDTVLVTESGNLKMTKAPETLEELTLPIKNL